MKTHKGSASQVVDLRGKTMIPGFVDAHRHIYGGIRVRNYANLSSPPVGTVTSIGDIVAELRKLQERLKIPKGQWIVGWGYDPDLLAEKRHPTSHDLDAIFPDNPVAIMHASGHGGVLNSAALRLSKITATTKTPPGGLIARKPGTNEPAGLLFETAWFPVVFSLPQPTEADLLEALERTQQFYASNGITTVQDGKSTAEFVQFIRKAAAQNRLYLDVVLLPGVFKVDDAKETIEGETFGSYDHRLKLGGIKIILDGSPQDKTAFMTKPYLTGPPGAENKAGKATAPNPPEDDDALPDDQQRAVGGSTSQ